MARTRSMRGHVSAGIPQGGRVRQAVRPRAAAASYDDDDHCKRHRKPDGGAKTVKVKTYSRRKQA